MWIVVIRYHPACVGMSIDEAKTLEEFVCSECSSEDDEQRAARDAKKSQNAIPDEAKVGINF